MEEKVYVDELVKKYDDNYEKECKEIDEQSVADDAYCDNMDTQREKRKIKRLKKRGIVTGAFIGGAAVALVGTVSGFVIPRIQGINYITQNFYDDVMDGIGISNGSNGYNINIGNVNVSFEYACDYIYAKATSFGYNDIETYIALQNIESPSFAESVVEKKPTVIEFLKETKQAYYEKKLNEGKTNGK